MNRKYKNISKGILNIIKKIKFKYFSLSLPDQAVMLLSFLGIFTLFMPWVIDKENSLKWNSFTLMSGNIGYIMIFMYLLILFIVVSSSYKEKIKLYTDINFKNHFIIIGTGLSSIFFGIICISFINGLAAIGQNITNGRGIILSMVIGIFIMIFGFINRSNYKKTNSEIILEQLNQNREKNKEKDNMTLPI